MILRLLSAERAAVAQHNSTGAVAMYGFINVKIEDNF